MSSLFRRVVLFLVFLIAVLQIIHMSLMSRLEGKRNIGKTSKINHNFTESNIKYTKDHVIQERKKIYDLLRSLSLVLDSSGEYRIVSFISTADQLKSSRLKFSTLSQSETLEGNNLYRKRDVSIVSHCTVHQLYNLNELSKRWNGLISVSVFSTSISQLPIIVETILFLRFCNPKLRRQASFHLVYPLNFSSKLNNRQVESVLNFLHWSNIENLYSGLNTLVTSQNCLQIRSSIEQLISNQSINYNHLVPYPNNLLRNMARRYAFTEYTLVIDIDLVPSVRFYEKFLDFIKKIESSKEDDFYISNNINDKRVETKYAFVVPTFEIDLNLSKSSKLTHSTLRNKLEEDLYLIPGNREELINGIEQRFIRPFYFELCWKCQKHTDYETWLRTLTSKSKSNDDKNSISIAFEVPWQDPWEPFYISRNNAPLYDERFRQYGFNRISQVCELHVSGFRFAVLNNVFLIHKGFKTPKNFHQTKDFELEQNRVLFRKFKLQLRGRYPLSSKKC